MSDNLPPGVATSDIPGNRPVDTEWEQFHEWLAALSRRHGLTADQIKTAITKGLRKQGIGVNES